MITSHNHGIGTSEAGQPLCQTNHIPVVRVKSTVRRTFRVVVVRDEHNLLSLAAGSLRWQFASKFLPSNVLLIVKAFSPKIMKVLFLRGLSEIAEESWRWVLWISASFTVLIARLSPCGRGFRLMYTVLEISVSLFHMTQDCVGSATYSMLTGISRFQLGSGSV